MVIMILRNVGWSLLEYQNIYIFWNFNAKYSIREREVMLLTETPRKSPTCTLQFLQSTTVHKLYDCLLTFDNVSKRFEMSKINCAAQTRQEFYAESNNLQFHGRPIALKSSLASARNLKTISEKSLSRLKILENILCEKYCIIKCFY